MTRRGKLIRNGALVALLTATAAAADNPEQYCFGENSADYIQTTTNPTLGEYSGQR